MSHPNPGKVKDVLNLSRDPVKHFVRVNGWLQAANKKFLKNADQNALRDYGLRYFTLCGKDGIDIYLFAREGLVTGNGRGFPSVFYCESYGGNFVKVKELLGKTRSYLGKFEKLIKKRWFHNYVLATPFDIVNLDFSGSCFPRAEQPFSNTLKSIAKIIELQKGNEFDLFITFKALRSAENITAINELVTNMDRNFRENVEIAEKFKECYEVESLNELLGQDYGKFLLGTFPKIIFGFGSSSNFIVKCRHKFIYGRTNFRGTNYQIIKFIFSFENFNCENTFTGASRRTISLVENYKESIMADFDMVPLDVDNEVSGNNALTHELTEDLTDILESRKAFGT